MKRIGWRACALCLSGFLASLAAGFLRTAPAQETAVSLDRVLARIGKDASLLWGSGPDYIGVETWRQKTLLTPPPRALLQLSEDSPKPPEPRETIHETVSLYALAAFRRSPESLFEFRKVLSVDGKELADPGEAREKFVEILRSKNDKQRKKIRESFLKQGAAGAAWDSGQTLLLFTKPRLRQYTFHLAGVERLGDTNAVSIKFQQQLGSQSLRVHNSGEVAEVPLKGEFLVRESDYGVLQVRLSAVHTQEQHPIVDELTVDYAAHGDALLPSSVVHKHIVAGKTETEDLFQYSDWRKYRRQ
ncbi:MAG TPA: hypothetical protein VHD76_10340 [Bryobacteraceae bacterium]|jgi:hypothetical protein|nr:hypothetical protein [Bryobacteraceae bacterium]